MIAGRKTPLLHSPPSLPSFAEACAAPFFGPQPSAPGGYIRGMEYLVLGAILLFAFIAFAPDELQKVVLALVWVGGAVSVVVAIIGGILR